MTERGTGVLGFAGDDEMTLEEAKNYFKQYGGHHFHMGREEPNRYRQYRALNVSDAMEDEWRENLADAALDSMAVPGREWLWYAGLNDQVRSFHTGRPDYCRRMRERAEKLVQADPMQRLGILRVLAGSAGDYSDGALRTMYDGGIAKADLQELVQRLADFPVYPEGDVPPADREQALQNCRNALKRLI